MVRVGGTDMKVEVGKGSVTYHPTFIATGLTGSKKKPLNLSRGKYLYHATASTNVPLIKQTGLKPRSLLSTTTLEFKGMEIESGRDMSADPIREHYQSMQKLAEMSEKEPAVKSLLEPMYFGDVGEFVYATATVETVAGYAYQIFGKGKKPVILRFKAGTDTWYEDAKENAVMGMTVITSGSIEKHEIQYSLSQTDANDPDWENFHRSMIEAEIDDAVWQAL